MKYGAGHLTGTDYPGEKGNAAIAAHISRAYGRMFNRLGELEAGDTIVIKDRHQTFKYTIFNTSIVSPDDTSVLKRNGEDQLLTLITCDPVGKAIHRLIIHARLVP
jgi:sortase A